MAKNIMGNESNTILHDNNLVGSDTLHFRNWLWCNVDTNSPIIKLKEGIYVFPKILVNYGEWD
jgi:hypothetical protein